MKTNLNKIDVSIIIVNYNNFELLENCLNSIYQHTTGITFEVIVVDNNSNEGDVSEITSKFRNVKLIKNIDNKGFSAANNQGFKIASGEYYLILNNDTFFLENTIKKTLDFVCLRKEKVFVGCRLLNSDKTYQESVMNFPSAWNTLSDSLFLSKIFKRSKFFNKNALSFSSVSQPIEVDVIKGAFIFCRSEDIKQLNGFDENFYFYSEELDLCKRFKKISGKIIYYPETSIMHIGGATVKNDELFFYKNQAVARIQYFQKHLNGIRFLLAVLFYYTGIIIRIPIYLLFGIISFKVDYFSKSRHYFKQLFYYPQNVFK